MEDQKYHINVDGGKKRLYSPMGDLLASTEPTMGREVPFILIHSSELKTAVQEKREGEWKSADEAFQLIAVTHERLTTTVWERTRRRTSKLLTNGPWAAVAAIAAIIGAILAALTFVNTLPTNETAETAPIAEPASSVSVIDDAD